MHAATANESRQRLFVAIEVPELVKERLAQAQERLRACVREGSVRWVSSSQVHLTLRFLGSVLSSDLTALGRGLETACQPFSSLSIEAAGIGFFPRSRAPRVVWAGVRGELEALSQLQRSIEQQVSAFSPEPGEERFQAHLTLGRVKTIGRSEVANLTATADTMNAKSFGKWTVSHICLIQSQLSSIGALYTVVSSVPLAA